LGARWCEIDWTEKTWTVPATRAKTNRDHIIPLSIGALAALREVEPLRGLSDDLIFPGKNGKALSCMTLLALLQRRMAEERKNKNAEAAAWARANEPGRYPRLHSIAKRAGRVGEDRFRGRYVPHLIVDNDSR
jgi:integrase